MRKSTIIFRCAADDCAEETSADFQYNHEVLNDESYWRLPEGWSEQMFSQSGTTRFAICCPKHRIKMEPVFIRGEA